MTSELEFLDRVEQQTQADLAARARGLRDCGERLIDAWPVTALAIGFAVGGAGGFAAARNFERLRAAAPDARTLVRGVARVATPIVTSALL